MRRPAFYSSSSRPGRSSAAAPESTPTATPPTPTTRAGLRQRLAATARHPGALWLALGILGLLLLMNMSLLLQSRGPALTQKQIDAAVMHTLENNVLPSPGTRAYETILPSVVRVVGFRTDPKTQKEQEHGVGTGVVIVDKGVILTNLHVVYGADRVQVTFMDGLESEAYIASVQPENDLAVLQARKIPDDLHAATMRSTADLAPGDQVMAVGFPFGIGPSASAGVVSGLKREFQSPEGKRQLTNLIQFDAAANPGNSGGPLVTMDGEVVGIVTAILNPTSARTFIGIGFAVPIENAATAAGMPPF